MDNFTDSDQTINSGVYPPKPILVTKKQNALTRSIISLLLYALMFYFIFDQNIVYIAAILLVIIIHEMGHFLFMKLFNYSNVKIFIVPLLGAFTSGKKQQVSQAQLSLIILAGPLPGIIIGCVLYFINKNIQSDTLKMLSNSFLLINLLNCLPFYPLDGGRLVEILFFKENHIIRLVFGIISVICLLFLFLYFKSLIMLIVPVFIAIEIYNEIKYQKIRDYLRAEKINYRTDYETMPDKDFWLIRDCLIMSFPKKYLGIQPGIYQYTIADSLFIQHVSAVLQVNLKSDLNIFMRIIILLAYISALIGPIILIGLKL